jgi:hypothetical protein
MRRFSNDSQVTMNGSPLSTCAAGDASTGLLDGIGWRSNDRKNAHQSWLSSALSSRRQRRFLACSSRTAREQAPCFHAHFWNPSPACASPVPACQRQGPFHHSPRYPLLVLHDDALRPARLQLLQDQAPGLIHLEQTCHRIGEPCGFAGRRADGFLQADQQLRPGHVDRGHLTASADLRLFPLSCL